MADIMKYIDALFAFVLGILGIFAPEDDASKTVAKVWGEVDAAAGEAQKFIDAVK